MNRSSVLVLSGDIGSGKTTICRQLAQIARIKKLDTKGIISPAVFENGKKTGIRLVDLKSQKSNLLAIQRNNNDTGLTVGRWAFDPETVQWANQILTSAIPCTLLIIDELGPLELNRQQGFTAGLKALDSGAYQAAVVTIRPSLTALSQHRWSHAIVRKIVPEEGIKKTADKIFRDIAAVL